MFYHYIASEGVEEDFHFIVENWQKLIEYAKVFTTFATDFIRG